jgi:uncharacterized protein (TIGR02594 family)
MANLPAKYQWLLSLEGVPAELQEALKHCGLLETKGAGNTVDIMKWSKEVGVSGWYTADSVPWCGLFKGVCAQRAGWLPKPKYDLLSALSWLAWGVVIDKSQAMLGDTLIFSRNGGGHVGWIEKSRLMGVRRAKWRISQPVGVKKFRLNRTGEVVSTNEA